MRITWKKPCILLFFALAAASLPAVEVRTAAIDLVLVIDKSLSMEEHIAEVKRYVENSLIRPVLMPGDGIAIVLFYGKSEILVNKTIKSEQDKEEILISLSRIRADGRWTDIGSALDALDPVLLELRDDGKLKYPLLLTDEHQEAPPDSRYFAPDGSFHHPYLSLVKKKDMGGWNLITLGIGLEGKLEKTAALIGKSLDSPAKPGEAEAEGKSDSVLPAESDTGFPIVQDQASPVKTTGKEIPDQARETESAMAAKTAQADDPKLSRSAELHNRWNFSKVPFYFLFLPPLCLFLVFFAFLLRKSLQSKGKAPR